MLKTFCTGGGEIRSPRPHENKTQPVTKDKTTTKSEK